MTADLASLLVIVAIAAAVPILIGMLRLPVPEVVLFLVLGVVFGPQLLDLITVDAPIDLISELGLGMLFFLAGFEVERAAIVGRDGRRALIGWLASIGVAVAAVLTLAALGIVKDGIAISIVLTTTALGTLLPILRERGELSGRFGFLFMGTGTFGELGPIVAIALFLGSRSMSAAIIALLIFALIVVALVKLPSRLRSQRLIDLINRGSSTASQTPLRLTIVLLVGLLTIAAAFGFDVVLGAFAAGMIVRRLAPHEATETLSHRMEAIAFGFFIPVFFIISGAKLDVQSIVEAPLRLIAFTVLLLVCRGLPQYLVYRRAIPDFRERTKFVLYTATALPLLVAVTEIELSNGAMLPENAAAVVGAGVLSVLLFPALAAVVGRRSRPMPGAATPSMGATSA